MNAIINILNEHFKQTDCSHADQMAWMLVKSHIKMLEVNDRLWRENLKFSQDTNTEILIPSKPTMWFEE